MRDVKLDDKYTLESGFAYMNGAQALVRLPMIQRQRDAAAGKKTAGFVSGYPGSPLGNYDHALHQAAHLLGKNHVFFQPGLNEDLAATAVGGSQQANQFEGAQYDGVFGIWYGKGPGVDRSGDAIKHGNYAGAAKNGGVLVMAGDDHGAKSSTLAHQSDQAFIHFGMPYLYPSSVQDYLDLGILGFAMSRYSGSWVGVKCVTDTVESSASVDVDPGRVAIKIPQDFDVTSVDLNLQWGVFPLDSERRLFAQRLEAVKAFARANKLDKIVLNSAKRRFGIITAGKAYLDVCQALDELGIDEQRAAELGLSLYKVAMPWPLEPEGIRAFADGLDEILVVEEKRPVIEEQLKSLFYHDAKRPRILGKSDETDIPLLSAIGELNPRDIALTIGDRVCQLTNDDKLVEALASLRQGMGANQGPQSGTSLVRLPSYCAGCPHNTSTTVPEGSVAMGGIGCHGMATFMPERKTLTLGHMGGEGAAWIGVAPFTNTKHIFQNLGDGTYFHSGLLAIRAAVASDVSMTYKILVNDAIAMTGGQEIKGQASTDQIAWQVHSEGVKQIAVVADDLDRLMSAEHFPPGATFHHRDDFDAVQKTLRDIEGVTVILYDQVCATEKRRRRKRGTYPLPDRRILINERVCDGCGDCSVQSNCIAIEPIETEFGRKRRINQSSCNTDYSCVKGFCPSFVSVYGATPKKRSTDAPMLRAAHVTSPDLPYPETSSPRQLSNILVTGVGGTGVVTVGALLGMAAHLEGKGCSVLDVTGLSQRNGAVTSHIRIARTPEEINASRIGLEQADVLIGADIVVAAGFDALPKVGRNRTHLVINTYVMPTSAFATNPDLDLSTDSMVRALEQAADGKEGNFIDATTIASRILGDAIGVNLFLMGLALQKGLLPVGFDALERAIELNGVAVDMNKQALHLGRQAAVDPHSVLALAKADSASPTESDDAVSDPVKRREALTDELIEYQGKRYARKFNEFVEEIAALERKALPDSTAFATAVSENLFKLMTYKDEYEVARLYTQPAFMDQLSESFDGELKLKFHMAPQVGKATSEGFVAKRTFGAWFLTPLKVLSKFSWLRGTPLDLFGRSDHRQHERKLIEAYRDVIQEVAGDLSSDTLTLAVEIAQVPDHIRGYGPVKERHMAEAFAIEQALLHQFRAKIGKVLKDPSLAIPE